MVEEKEVSPYDFVIYGSLKFANSSIRLVAAEEGSAVSCGWVLESITIASVWPVWAAGLIGTTTEAAGLIDSAIVDRTEQVVVIALQSNLAAYHALV